MNIEKMFLPEDLIEVFDSLEYEEYGYLEVNSFNFINHDVFFNFSLSVRGLELRKSQLWQVKIENCKDFKISFERVNNYFDFNIDHIALMQYQQPVYELYFKSTATNPESLYVAIQELHSNLFNNYISSQYLNANLLALCKAKNGLFARGAKPVLDYYFTCLQEAGKEPYFFNTNVGNDSKNDIYKLMSLGSIYFIGTDFIFEKIK